MLVCLCSFLTESTHLAVLDPPMKELYICHYTSHQEPVLKTSFLYQVSAAARTKRCCPHPDYANRGEDYTCCPCDCPCDYYLDFTLSKPRCFCYTNCPPPPPPPSPPPPPPSGGGGGCFPSTAKVNLENGKSVKMSDLELGNRVQIGTNSISMCFYCSMWLPGI